MGLTNLISCFFWGHNFRRSARIAAQSQTKGTAPSPCTPFSSPKGCRNGCVLFPAPGSTPATPQPNRKQSIKTPAIQSSPMSPAQESIREDAQLEDAERGRAEGLQLMCQLGEGYRLLRVYRCAARMAACGFLDSASRLASTCFAFCQQGGECSELAHFKCTQLAGAFISPRLYPMDNAMMSYFCH